MPALYVKLVPLIVSCALFVAAFRIHERYWTLGFSGWKQLYLGLAAVTLGSLIGVVFEFAEPRAWQSELGWPLDWVLMGTLACLGAALLLWGLAVRLSLQAREKNDLELRREAYELLGSIREAARGPFSLLEILDFSLKEILRKVDADAGGVWLLNFSGSEYILASGSGFSMPLQQKLERVPATHPGFSRLAVTPAPRELAEPNTLQRLFPELHVLGAGYNRVLGIPLVAGFGAPRQREPLGMIVLCSRNSLPSAVDLAVIDSAVTFLAATVAEARAYRLVRSQRQAQEKQRVAEEEFAGWVQGWTRETGAQRRFQAALAGLADHAGDFVGAGRYAANEDRWEPLALAGAALDRHVLGDEGFRRAAARAIETGKEALYRGSISTGGSPGTTAFQMIPVEDPHRSGRFAAALFLPAGERLPSWWQRSVPILVELMRVVLAVDSAPLRESAVSREPPADQGLRWAGLGYLIRAGIRNKLEELPDLLTELLPEGWRVALWHSLSGPGPAFRLRIAAAAGCPATYYSTDQMESAPVPDRIEIDAHLGGLIRVVCIGESALGELWPDFADGWQGERVPFSLACRDRGWVTFYRRTGGPELDLETRSFFQCLAGLLELLIPYALSFRPTTGDSMTEAAARILVVDEEEWIRELLVGMLGVLGYQATSASSVEDGRQKFTAGHFRCVICGSSIISGAGGDFLHHLKNYRRQTRILLVKEPGPAGAAELQTECVDYVLSKPFRIDDLRLALEAPVAPLSG